MHAPLTLTLTLLPALVLPSCPPDRFFERPDIEFWGPRPQKKAGAETPPPHLEADLPPPVRELIADPTPERARAYLAWQRERIERLRKAMRLLEEVSKEARRDP
jgi:hypothetical protein